jgi:hypothetical protein
MSSRDKRSIGNFSIEASTIRTVEIWKRLRARRSKRMIQKAEGALRPSAPSFYLVPIPRITSGYDHRHRPVSHPLYRHQTQSVSLGAGPH